MRIIKTKKFAKSFNELYDYVDDDTVEMLDQYEQKDFDVVDYDSLEMGEVPITDNNVDDVLVDNLIDEYGDEGEGDVSIEEFPIEEAPTVIEPLKEVPTEEEVQEQETPKAEESIPDPENDAKKHFGRDIVGALEWAKEKKRVVQIFYNTAGEKRGRGGKEYLKRELNIPKLDGGGVNINRIIEPHYFFHAKTTKRDILVTYDRSVRHIRAFIVDNITDYNFTKKRGTDEDQYFGRTNRPGIKVPIDTKPIKGVDKMENINDSLTEMEASLKSKGLVKSASVVKNAENILKSIKTAQYVGVQGYWIRNRRCWDNCYRQKRATQPETPAQEVWMQCWGEYNEALNNPKSGWEKYAKKNKDMKISAKKEKQLNKIFASHVSIKVKKGMSTPEAVYTVIGERSNIQRDQILKSSSQLMELADTLSNSGEKDLGESLAGISAEVLKEADFTGNAKGALKEAGFGNLIKGLGKSIADKWRGGPKEPAGQEELTDISDRLEMLRDDANTLVQKLQGYSQQAGNPAWAQPPKKNKSVTTSNKSIIIEAGKGTRIVKEALTPEEKKAWEWEEQQKYNRQQQTNEEQAKWDRDQQLQSGQMDAATVDEARQQQNDMGADANEQQQQLQQQQMDEAAGQSNYEAEQNNMGQAANEWSQQQNQPRQGVGDPPDENNDGIDDTTGQKIAPQSSPYANTGEFNTQDLYQGGGRAQKGKTTTPQTETPQTTTPQTETPQGGQEGKVSRDQTQEYMDVFEQANDTLSVFGRLSNTPAIQQALQPAIANITKVVQQHNQMANTGQFDIGKMITNLQSLSQSTMLAQQKVNSAAQAGGVGGAGVGGAGVGGAGAGGAGAGGMGGGAGIAQNGPQLSPSQAPQQADPYSKDSIGQMTLEQLGPIKKIIDDQITMLTKNQPITTKNPNSRAAAYNHKLKLMK